MDGILTNFAEALLLKHLCGVETHTPKGNGEIAAAISDDQGGKTWWSRRRGPTRGWP